MKRRITRKKKGVGNSTCKLDCDWRAIRDSNAGPLVPETRRTLFTLIYTNLYILIYSI